MTVIQCAVITQM